MTGLTPWQEVAVTLAVGCFFGLVMIFVLFRRSGISASGARPTDGTRLSRDDVSESYHRAIDQLRELDEQASALDASYVQTERARQERKAAALLGQLQALDALNAQRVSRPQVPRQKPQPVLPAFLRRRPKLVGFMWGVSISALGLFLWTTVQQGSTPRPGPPVAAPAEAAPGATQMDQGRFAELQEAIKANPNDVPALLELAHMLLRAQMLEEAQTVNDRALQLDGNNLEGLTHAAVLAASRGEQEGAQAGLTMVLKKDPGFAEAWFFRGMLSMQAGNMDVMQESLQQYMRYAPEGPQKERVRAMLGRAKTTP